MRIKICKEEIIMKVNDELKYRTDVLMKLTSEALKKNNLQSINFEWGFRLDAMPWLELYDDNGKIHTTLPLGEFSELIQVYVKGLHIICIELLKNKDDDVGGVYWESKHKQNL